MVHVSITLDADEYEEVMRAMNAYLADVQKQMAASAKAAGRNTSSKPRYYALLRTRDKLEEARPKAKSPW